MTVDEKIYEVFKESSGISTDSRSVAPGQLFFALSGENFDGNKFAQNALDAGAIAAVVSDYSLDGSKMMRVADTLASLQNVAALYREDLDIPFLGITGSNGKTTTKELVNAVLEQKYRVHCTPGNYNNHIGVPLTILSIPVDTEFAIIEMGANHVGEIAELCKIARPSHGLITNIGTAHIEGFGSEDGVRRGKGELFDFLRTNGGVAFVNLGERFLEDLASGVVSVTYKVQENLTPDVAEFNMYLSDYKESIEMTLLDQKGVQTTFHSDLFGVYNAQNVAAAVAVALHFGVDSASVAKAIAAYRPRNNRSQIVSIGQKRIILDAYNANPSSVRWAVSGLMEREGPKSLILGGMNELGAQSKQEHQKLVDELLYPELLFVALVGEHYEGLDLPKEVLWFTSTELLIEYLKSNALPKSTVLVKGSRSLGLESVLSHIK